MQVITLQHEGKVVQPITDERNKHKQDCFRQVLIKLLALDCKSVQAVEQFFSDMDIEE